MIADLLAGLAKANLAGAAAVLAVLALRRPVRSRMGARAAYGLWLAVPAAALAALAPHPAARPGLISAEVIAAAQAFVAAPAAAAPAGLDAAALAFGLWLAGAIAMSGWLAAQQARFGRAARAGLAGPAVMGVLKPRIVTPADFEARFAAEERALILAHEAAHLRSGDAAVNALACALLCLAWFNPLAHLAARRMRIDQELACDAAVIDRHPQARRRYAELLLKTQIDSQDAFLALPLGCHWPATGAHPLKERIAMLKSPLPGRGLRVAGVLAAAGVTAGLGLAAWAAEPGAPPARPDVSPDAPATITMPTWLEKPTGADVARYYPPEALKRGIGGMTLLTCRVTADGRLESCAVARAEAIGDRSLDMEFGTAALKLALIFRMAPVDRQQARTAGGVIRIPIRFMIPTPAPKA